MSRCLQNKHDRLAFGRGFSMDRYERNGKQKEYSGNGSERRKKQGSFAEKCKIWSTIANYSQKPIAISTYIGL